jgi:nitroreductase
MPRTFRSSWRASFKVPEMSAEFPDSKTIRAALTMAVRAPSVHNTQPWLWRVAENSVHLHSNPSLQLPNADPDSRDLMISCGIALNHCAVAFAALGWLAKPHRFPNPADGSHLAAMELEPYPATEVDIALAAAILRRRTDRRRYSARPVSAADISLMGARAARAGVMLRNVESLTRLGDLVSEAAYRHANSFEYLNELSMWSGRYASHAGVPARSAPRFDPATPIPRRAFAGPRLTEPQGISAADDGGVVLALGTRDDDDVARLRAGEATSAVLLTATALGLASCPITEPLEIKEIRDEVAADVFGTSGYPQMLLRIGWAPVNAEPLPATPRRPLSDVVTWPDRT